MTFPARDLAFGIPCGAFVTFVVSPRTNEVPHNIVKVQGPQQNPKAGEKRMNKELLGDDIHARVSLEPLIQFWEKELAPGCSHMALLLDHLKEQIQAAPELQGEIEDITCLEAHRDIIHPLMSAVFAQATFNTEISGALTPAPFSLFS